MCGFVILQLGKKSEVMVCFTWNDTLLIISGLWNVKDGRMFIAITKGPIIFKKGKTAKKTKNKMEF